jgi:hypothetical protein
MKGRGGLRPALVRAAGSANARLHRGVRMKQLMRSTPLLMILPSLALAMFIIGYPIIDLAGPRCRK